MNKIIVLLVLCSFSAGFVSALDSEKTGKVEVSFSFTKQSGFSSNQFAVWIEDAQGGYVKTLYATKFTATGGWQKRENSIPRWVKQSNLAGMSKAQVDAITGPTPKSGTLRYSWDGKDYTGKEVKAGEYRVYVEATLRDENQVLYMAIVILGESGKVSFDTESNAKAQYFGANIKERKMIGPVTVTSKI